MKFTIRDVAVHANVPEAAARALCGWLEGCGQIKRVGVHHPEGRKAGRGATLYEPTTTADAATAAYRELLTKLCQ